MPEKFGEVYIVGKRERGKTIPLVHLDIRAPSWIFEQIILNLNNLEIRHTVIPAVNGVYGLVIKKQFYRDNLLEVATLSTR